MPAEPPEPARPGAGQPLDLLDEALRILHVTADITRTLDPEEIPARTVKALYDLLGFSPVSVALRARDSEELRIVADHGLPEAIRTLGFRQNGTAHQVMISGEPVFVENIEADPRANPETTPYYKAYACLPITGGRQTYGVLFVNAEDPHAFSEIERQILTLFAIQMGIALENAHLNLHLKTALEQVKTLSGLIPICSYCKKVRTDQGFWQQVEAYLHERTEATFSHGICPSCSEQAQAEQEAIRSIKISTSW